ncbi:N-6 DNA methylase [Flavobacterium sp.]|uniref:N-6 DNA methylase n=1 Tax=Flavobacterium sp. TaxID=239 RepID=UPI0026023226|nr:N-6 DNA methylase [Flavobacterium sp.]
MNTEDLVISLIEDYKFAGLLPENLEQRKTFLTILAALLVSKTHNNYLDELLINSFNAEFESTCEFEFLKQSHRVLFDELKDNYLQSSSVSQSTFNSIKPLIEHQQLTGISALSAVEIYDKTLQRLQKMNVADRSSRLFQYDYFPAELAQFVAKLAGGNKGVAVCEPSSNDAKMAIMTCSYLDVTFAAVSCVKQSPDYVAHLLAIAGVHQSVASEGPISADTKFDLTLLLQPEAAEIEELINSHLPALADNCLCIALVGQGFLVGKQHLEIRKQLLAKGFVQAVIELPAKLLSPATPALFALLLSKGDPTRNVTFESYGDHFVTKGRVNVLHIDENAKPDFSLSVSSDSIPADNANLVPKSYMQIQSTDGGLNIGDIRKQLLELQHTNDHHLRQLFEML